MKLLIILQWKKKVTMNKFLEEVEEEYKKASAKHPDFPTMHHGLAVIWEEFEELKQEIFKKNPDLNNLKLELVQIAAMCLRFNENLMKIKKYRYRWLYSEGYGEWQRINLPISFTEDQIQQEMKYIEESEGSNHGCRWSGFEYEVLQ